MKKLLIILTLLLFVGAGYFTYDKWVKHSDLTVWSFVPSDAAFVFELEVKNDLTSLEANPIWNNLANTDALKELYESIDFLDSINGTGGFTAIFKRLPALISVHRVSNASLDFLMVLDIQNLSQNTFISAAVGRLKKAGYRYKTRTYNGFEISEIGSGPDTFTYIFYKNYFLASFTPYLVEDAIRTIEEADIESFKEAFPETKTGKVHVNFKAFSNALEAFVVNDMNLPLRAGSFDYVIDSVSANISGLSSVTEGWISNTDPGTFEMTEVIPIHAASVHHISYSNLLGWSEQQKVSGEIGQIRDSLRQTLDFGIEQVFGLLDNEIGVVNLESRRPDDQRKLLILKVNDVDESLGYFQSLAERIAYARGDTVYTESYSENEIRFLAIKDFPELLIGKLGENFERSFYVNMFNYLIFSNNLEALKNLLSSIEAENTWRKSLPVNNFLNSTSADANHSVMVNLPRFWPDLQSTIVNEWKDHFRDNAPWYKKFEFASFQVSNVDDQYFTNVTLTQTPTYAQPVLSVSPDNVLTLAEKITSKPFLVRSHAHNFFDVIVQDSSMNLYYMDQSFSSQWSIKLQEKIASEIFEIDYYRNNKLQVAFATETNIHIIDRTGAYIPGYPKTLPRNEKISFFNLIDYDRSRSYRFGITDSEGKVFLSDKDLKLLDGWDPIPYQRRATKPLRHARLGGRDVMISIQENGLINVTNRRGEKQPNFPFDVQSDLSADYFLNASNSLGRSSISVITKQGELVEINLEGFVINRDQLLKSSVQTSFEMISDRGNNSYIILRRENNQYDILDATGNLLFSKDYFSSQVDIQYYQFGGGKDLVIFRDLETKTLYIFDKSGQLVTGNPLFASNKVSILYSSSKRELQIYATNGNNLELYQFDY